MDYKSKAETDDDSYGVILWQTIQRYIMWIFNSPPNQFQVVKGKVVHC